MFRESAEHGSDRQDFGRDDLGHFESGRSQGYRQGQHFDRTREKRSNNTIEKLFVDGFNKTFYGKYYFKKNSS